MTNQYNLLKVEALAPILTEMDTKVQAAEDSADKAELFDGPKFDTFAIASAYTGFTSGQRFVIWEGFNGEPETFQWVADSTLTIDGALVLTSEMPTGRLISTRTVFGTVAAMLADVRVLAVGTSLQADGFNYTVAASAATDHHLTTAGGVKLYATATQSGDITVKQVGGVEGTDITEALQHAIMVASFGDSGNPIAGRVLVDVNEAILSDTIHVHYGKGLSGAAQFRGVRVEGLGRPYQQGDQHMGTRLLCTMTDRPAFVVQLGRFTKIGGFNLIGPARDEISAMDFEGFEPRSEAGWDAALTTAGITPNLQYAPHAAIAIDPYSGPEPATAYPSWDLHPWILGSTSQYGSAGGSSQTTLFDMAIDGWEVGVVQQPGDISANSDFFSMNNIEFRNVKYGDSVGSSQSRNTTRNNCTYNRVWAMTTNNKHGQRIGTLAGSFNNCSGAGFIGNLFDVNALSYGGGLAYNQLDVESLWLLGNVDAGNTGETGIQFNACQIGFGHRNDEIHPGNIITGSTSGTVRFTDCNFQGFDSVLATCNLSNFVSEGSTINPQSSRSKDYEKLAHNALGGGLVPYLIGIKPQVVRFTPFVIGGSKQDMQMVDGSFKYNSRDYCTPIFAGPSTFFATYLSRLQTRAPLSTYRSRTLDGQFTVTSQVGRTITIDLSSEFSNEQNVLQYGYLPGDVVVHEFTGTVMFVRSTDDSGAVSNPHSDGTGEVILEMQNNYYDNAGTYEPIDDSFLDTDEEWTFTPSRQYAPECPVIGATDTASSDISVFAGAGGAVTNYGLAVGDCLFENSDLLEAFTSTGSPIIGSIDVGAGTITMGGVADQTLPMHSFDWWMRQPPANAGSR